jgi:cyclic pyranopterin phosphate synthase
VHKLRLTGGEPLLRHELPKLVAMLAEIPGVDIALTTNGSLLSQQAQALADAGLRRVTVSLDSLDERVFREMNDAEFSVARVLEGIDAAGAAGLTPVKINAVVRRGVNDRTAVELARHFKGTGCIVRFIEYMDVGTTNGWRLDDVVPGAEIVRAIAAEMPLEPLEPNYDGEVVERWRYADGGGEVGVITSVTQPFCGACTRARLSADGSLYTCLFATTGTDLKRVLRSDADDGALASLVEGVWRRRDDRYSEQRSEATAGLRRVEMSYIGG